METQINDCGCKLKTIVKLVADPEEARALGADSFGGIRIVIDEVLQTLWGLDDRDAECIVEHTGYKLSMLAALLDSEDHAADFSHDAWSGIRILLSEITKFLLGVKLPLPSNA